MKPVRIESKKGQFTVIHGCVKCKIEKPNKLGKLDNLIKLIKVIQV